MTVIQALILGIIEGVTEFLPISSTGHLVLASRLLGVADSYFTKSFEIIIQCGAILAVVALYGKRFFLDKESWKKILIAWLPTAVSGFLLYKLIKEFLLSSTLVVLVSLFVGGFVLIFFEMWHRKRDIASSDEIDNISRTNAFFIGMAQSLAVIPGVSRAGATIIGGLLLGVKRETIVEFSFLLAIPTMAAATAYDLFKSAGDFSFNQLHLLLIGFIVSFIVALITIQWLLHFIKNHTFISFGIYRIILALLFWFAVK